MRTKIKVFRDGVGFSFWHHFDNRWGTGIRCRRVKPGLFGIFYHPIPRILTVGFWWTWDFELIGIPYNRFEVTTQKKGQKHGNEETHS